MPEEVVYYVTKYGYYAIFIMVFLQETGMPNPFPNELLLMFSGYLCFKSILFFPYVILTIIAADLIGTSILYFLFFYTGTIILQKKPKWIPISERMIEKLTVRITSGGKLSIFIFRLTPFTRGYTSVITGLLQIRPKVYLPIALASAATWAGFYVVTGYLIGPSWNMFTHHMENFKYLLLAALIVTSVVVASVWYFRKKEKIG